jgi:hypothetical protein
MKAQLPGSSAPRRFCFPERSGSASGPTRSRWRCRSHANAGARSTRTDAAALRPERARPPPATTRLLYGRSNHERHLRPRDRFARRNRSRRAPREISAHFLAPLGRRECPSMGIAEFCSQLGGACGCRREAEGLDLEQRLAARRLRGPAPRRTGTGAGRPPDQEVHRPLSLTGELGVAAVAIALGCG